jgi:4-hydroxy-2-oxoheptanedioate aldolase
LTCSGRATNLSTGVWSDRSFADCEEIAVRENTLRTIWGRGDAVVNGWLSIPSGFSAEVMAHQGFDSLTVDMQHGVVDYQAAVTMLQAVSTTSVIPLARVPWNDPAFLMKILDAGVYGVICPMVNTADEAEALVRACKYPPRGYRSWGPVRASIYAGTDYGDRANQDLIVMPMIETAEAVKNLDDILSVSGVDAVYVGPSDLSLTLGCTPRLDQTDPPVVEAQQKIVAACKRHGVIAGIHNATPAYALKMIEAGYQFVTLASDSRFLAARAAEEVAAVRKSGTKAGKLPAY